jgi:integrase
MASQRSYAQKAKREIKREKVKPGIWKRIGTDGRPRYEITFRDSDGKQRRQVVEGGVRAAERALNETKAKMGKGERVAPRRDLTFAEVAETWMAKQGATLRPATQAAYRTTLDTHLMPAWGSTRLDRIDVDAVAALVERMQTASYRAELERRHGLRRPEGAQQTGYSAWTIRGVLVPAGRIFDFARRRMDWAGTNPVRDLDRGERPRSKQRDRRILSRDELTAVLNAAEEPYKTLIAAAAVLGTRLGETLGLTWGDVDFEQGIVHVRYQIDRFGQRVELKTARSRRIVEMPGSLIAALRALRLRSAHNGPDDLVFASRTGGPMEHENVRRRGLRRAYQRARLPGRTPTFHELRHSHASAWIAEGGDLVELSSRLGHRDPAITASIYSHDFEAAARSSERRARLDRLYGVDDDRSSVAAAEVSGGQQSDDAQAKVQGS